MSLWSARRRCFYKEENGKKLEPVERFVCDVPSDYMGAVMESWAAAGAS